MDPNLMLEVMLGVRIEPDMSLVMVYEMDMRMKVTNHLFLLWTYGKLYSK